MTFFQEPEDRPGASQILDTDDGQGNRAKVWLNTRDNTSAQKFSGWTVGASAIVWVASAGLFAKAVLFVQHLIQVGLIGDLTAVFALALTALVLWYSLFFVKPTARFYRLLLFALGVLLAVL